MKKIMKSLLFQCLVSVFLANINQVNSAPEIVRPRGVAISSKSLYCGRE